MSLYALSRRRGTVWKVMMTLVLIYLLSVCLFVKLPAFLYNPPPSFTIPEGLSVDDVIRGEWRHAEGPVLYYPSTCRPRRNVAFIKCMKCGTESLATVLRRYAYNNDLSSVLPIANKIYLGWPYPMTSLDYRPSSRGYNMLVEHAIYNATGMRRLMNADTAFITIIREPLDMFVSILNYFNVFEIANVTVRHGMEAVQTYLRNMEHYESVYKSHAASRKRYCIPDGFSITKNLLAHCLGMPLGFPAGTPDVSRYQYVVEKYIQQLDSEFVLVMLLEYFNESLVLLRRLLCWEIKDVIYHANNKGAYRKNITWDMLTDSDRHIHKQHSAVDYALYQHFNRTFWRKVSQQGDDFFQEVDLFRQVQEQVTWFCSKVATYGRSFIRFPESPWSLAFTFSADDCKLMKNPLLDLLKIRYVKQEPHYAHYNNSKLTRKYQPLC